MKKQINLKKLLRLNIIQLVDPSERLKKSYLDKSGSSLLSAKILQKNNQSEDAISLSYFSMYNCLLALMYKCGIKCENHNASIFLLDKLFNIDNSLLEKAKKERVDKQYYPDFSVSKQETLNSIISAEEFNSHLFDFIEKINNRDIERFRNKLKELGDF